MLDIYIRLLYLLGLHPFLLLKWLVLSLELIKVLGIHEISIIFWETLPWLLTELSSLLRSLLLLGLSASLGLQGSRREVGYGLGRFYGVHLGSVGLWEQGYLRHIV